MPPTFAPQRREPITWMLVLAGLSLLTVSALAVRTLAARSTSEESVRRARRTLATIGGNNFARSSRAVLANHTADVTSPLLNNSWNLDEAFERVVHFADSLARCDCPLQIKIERVLLIDQSGVASHDRTLLGAPSASWHTPADWPAPLPSEEPRLTFDSVGRTPTLIAIRDIPATARHERVRAVVIFPSEELGTTLLPGLYKSFGPLVPLVLSGAKPGDVPVGVRFRAGAREHAVSPIQYDSLFTAVVPFTLDSSAWIVASSNPLLAMPYEESQALSEVFLLAIATVLAVLATTALAWRASQLTRLRSEFTTAVTHELRTPLTEIILFSELLESGRTRTADSVRDAGRIIKTEAKRLHQMVENALHISRTDQHLLQTHAFAQPLAPIIRETVTAFAPIAASRGVCIDVQIGEAVEAPVDAEALRHVIRNLLDNAVRYGPDNQHVAVRAAVSGGVARMTVSDQGPGIPVADRARVVQRYARLERDMASTRTGTGLGLAVAHELACAMGAEFSIDDAESGGTAITLAWRLS